MVEDSRGDERDFTGCSRIPEGMKEGKEMAAGTRIPPSHVVPFPEIFKFIESVFFFK